MPHHVYKRHFIKNVIFRIDFPIAIQSLEACERPVEFQRAVLGEFPILEEQNTVKQEVQLSADGVRSTQKEARLYTFHNSNRTCKIGLEYSFLFLEDTDYQGFDAFSRLVDLAVNSLYTIWPNIPVNRLGLRYLNEISIPGINAVTEWERFINSGLLAAINLYGSEKLSRYIVQTEFKGEDYSARILTGIPNPDYPGLIRQQQFIVDLDLYTNEAIERQDIRLRIDRYHEAIINYFENSITQSLREYMDAG